MTRTTKTLLCVAIMLGIACAMPCLGVAAETSEQVENFPSGKPKVSYTVDAEGVREGPFKEYYEDGLVKIQGSYRAGKLHGSYKELYPSGKPKRKGIYKKGVLSGKYSEFNEKGVANLTATYRDGKLHGVRKQLVGRKPIAEEVWVEGELTLPKSKSFLKKELMAISKAKIEMVGEIPPAPEAVVVKIDDSVINQVRETGVRRLMMYRAVCNLAYENMVLDRTYIAHAEAAAMVLAKRFQVGQGNPSHQPPNPGVPDDLYKLGYTGTTNSNLQHDSHGHTPADSVCDYMFDTDHPLNVVRLGHRRWCLHPNLLKTGFGKAIVNKHSSMHVMWAFDGSRKEIPDYDMFAFPARGIQPVSLLIPKKPYAWSVSFNASKYRMPSDQTLKVKVVKCKFDTKRFRIVRDDKPYALEHVHVSIEQYSYPPAVIFQPKDLDHSAGNSYWVEVSGVKNADGTDAEIGYLVSFEKL